jgi:hypothetical protein
MLDRLIAFALEDGSLKISHVGHLLNNRGGSPVRRWFLRSVDFADIEDLLIVTQLYYTAK